MLQNFKKSAGNELTLLFKEKGLKIIFASINNSWGDNLTDDYTYQEESAKTSDGSCIYTLKVADLDFFKQYQFKHFILVDSAENSEKIVNLIKSAGFCCTGKGDLLNGKRRVWFTIPSNSFLGTRGEGVFQNNILV